MHIQDLLGLCVERKASDLHLSTGMPPLLRIDGDLEPIDEQPLSSEQVAEASGEVANATADSTAHDVGEADFCVELPGLARFRVNSFRQERGPALAFRLIPSAIPGMEELGMGSVFRRIADAPHGLALVTGATGSGKSTTLAAMVDYVNRSRKGHILTIEDPVEFVHPSRRCLVSQRQLGRDTQSFATALRAALRQDPDVILIGEMRDLETIRLALTAAETGHLVLATLHTSGAAQSIDRIIDVFPAGEKETVRAMLSEALQAIVSQKLLKRVGGGRVAAHEILLATPAVRNLIREGKVAQLRSTMQTSAAIGMKTLEQSKHELVAAGLVRDERAAVTPIESLPETAAPRPSGRRGPLAPPPRRLVPNRRNVHQGG